VDTSAHEARAMGARLKNNAPLFSARGVLSRARGLWLLRLLLLFMVFAFAFYNARATDAG
jgi:hypothetical protein